MRAVRVVAWLACAVAVAACGASGSNSDAHGDGGASGASGSGAASSCPAPGTTAPTDVFCIGLYLDHDPTHHAKDANAYTPGVTLWSDGAEKQRYLYLPPGAQIDTSDMDSWKFPVGTKAFKEFRFNGKLVETRLAWKQAEANWVLATYIWDAAQKAAPLNDSYTPVLLDTGYEIPTARDCGKCHHGGSDKLLGVEAVALALPTAQGFTLEKLVAGGWLNQPPASTSITLPEDSTGKAGEALGYLHANCGMPCHSGRGLGEETQLLLRLRADQFWPSSSGDDAGTDPVSVFVPHPSAVTSDAYRVGLNAKPTTAAVEQAFPGAFRITPGAHDKSLLWLLPHRRGKYQMPPLVSHTVDDAGTAKIAAWIDALNK